MNILNIAVETVNRFNMICPGDRILISVSGGPDSVFLTLFLSDLIKKYRTELFAFHLDHQTRQGDSAKDAEFVKRFCEKLSIPLFFEKTDSARWCRERKLNFQEGSRLLRKNLLKKYSDENQIDKIALAHNADDFVETFFINFLRGSDLKGISSIKPRSEKIIRPLIHIYKKDIISYLDKNKISYCTDYTNLEESYLRNKIRLSLIPYIETDFRKDIKKKIFKIAEAAAEADEFIEKTALSFFKKYSLKNKADDLTNKKDAGFLKFNICKVRNLEKILIKRLIILSIELLKGDKRDIGRRIINSILVAILKSKPSVIHINAHLRFQIAGCNIYFYDAQKININTLLIDKKNETINYFFDRELKDKEIILLTATEIKKLEPVKTILKKNLNDYGFRFEFDIISAENIDADRLKSLQKNEAMFDLSEIAFPLKLRSWRYGDYFKPFGGNFRKKLHDFFIDMKLPKYYRGLVPLITDAEKILWLVPFRTSDEIRIKKTSNKVLHIKIFDISN